MEAGDCMVDGIENSQLLPTLIKTIISALRNNSKAIILNLRIMYIYRGYYTAARRYDFYLRVVKTIFYERAQRVSKIFFLTREDKSHIFKPPCNVLFIITVT